MKHYTTTSIQVMCELPGCGNVAELLLVQQEQVSTTGNPDIDLSVIPVGRYCNRHGQQERRRLELEAWRATQQG